ncbi:MAG: ABC transporter ATP-binding protein [Anaerolineae bacterium]
MRVWTEGLRAGYDRQPVLWAINLKVEDGEMVGVIGPNGSGKSTLLKVLGRLLKPWGGVVYLDGRHLAELSPGEVARCMATLPQAPTSPPELTVYELVGYGRYPHVAWLKRLGPADRAAIDRAIRECRLEALTGRPLSALSGGERQRAWLAMALAQEPRVMLLDEPVTFLDINHQLEMLDLIAALNRERGITVVMVMHDINLAARYCRRLVALKGGRVAHDGPVEAVLRPEVLREVFHVEVQVGTDPVTGRPACYPCRPVSVAEVG